MFLQSAPLRSLDPAHKSAVERASGFAEKGTLEGFDFSCVVYSFLFLFLFIFLINIF